MDAKELAKKVPMAMPGFTVITPKATMEYDKMILDRQISGCEGCEGVRSVYPPPSTSENVPATDKKEQPTVSRKAHEKKS
jgi:hypothetical protein